MLKRFTYSLFLFALYLGNIPLSGQTGNDCLLFEVGEVTASQGETICVDVTTQGFENIISFQYTLQWDPALLSLIDVRNFDIGSVNSTFGVSTEQLALGRLPVAWFDPNLSGTTVADNDEIFTICFEVLGSEGFAPLSFGNTPTPFEVTVKSNNNFGLETYPAAVTFGGVNIGNIDTSSLSIDEICVQSGGCSGEGLASIEATTSGGEPGYSYNWTGPSGFSAATSNIIVTEKGIYELSVVDQSGAMAMGMAIVEDNGTTNFISGTVTNVFCGETNNGSIVLSVPDEGNFDFIWSTGATSQNLDQLEVGEYTVTVTNGPGDCSAVKTFEVKEEQLQAALFYNCLEGEDPSIETAEIIATVINEGTGPYTFSWSTGEEVTADNESRILLQLPASVSVTITDQSSCTYVSHVLNPTCEDQQQENEFSVSHSYNCVEGDTEVDLTAFVWAGGTAPFSFNWSTGVQEESDHLSTIRVSTQSTYSVTVTDADDLVEVIGGITPNCNPDPATPLQLTIGEANVTTGETVCLAMRADGFRNLLGMQYAVSWDPALVQLSSVQSFNLPGLSSNGFNLTPSQIQNGILRMSWHDSQSLGVSMPDGASLYEMCFTVLGTSGEVPIYFDEASMLTELVNDNNAIVPPVLNNGLLIINGDERVWPGDTDQNERVNHYDLLNIGLAFGAAGPQRPDANLSWTGQWADDWDLQTPETNLDYKYIDTNGDGVINALDTTAMSLNWGQTINFVSDPFDEFRRTPGQPKNLNAPLFVETYTLASGETARFNIHLGDIENPAEGAYGIAFTIVYDPMAVVYGSARASFQSSWLGNLGENMIAFFKDDPNNHRIHIGLTRTDQSNVSGSGVIGELSLTIEDVIFRTTEYEMLFEVENVRLIDAAELEILVDEKETRGVVSENPLDVAEIPAAEKIKIYPNPTTNTIQLDYQEIVVDHLQIWSLEGQLLRDYKAMNEISLQELPPATYLLRFIGPQGAFHKRVVKQ